MEINRALHTFKLVTVVILKFKYLDMNFLLWLDQIKDNAVLCSNCLNITHTESYIDHADLVLRYDLIECLAA